MDGQTDGDRLTMPLPPAAVNRLTFITIAALNFQVHTHEPVQNVIGGRSWFELLVSINVYVRATT